MNYELAKELKEAGFPQRSGPHACADKCDCGLFGLSVSCHLAYIPTLSELIEACGEQFESLSRTKPYADWKACSWDDDIAWGTTPEEAVARLWLAINKQV